MWNFLICLVGVTFLFQVGEEVTEDFTKEVLMMWKVLVVEGEKCIALKAGRKGTGIKKKDVE